MKNGVHQGGDFELNSCLHRQPIRACLSCTLHILSFEENSTTNYDCLIRTSLELEAFGEYILRPILCCNIVNNCCENEY